SSVVLVHAFGHLMRVNEIEGSPPRRVQSPRHSPPLHGADFLVKHAEDAAPGFSPGCPPLPRMLLVHPGLKPGAASQAASTRKSDPFGSDYVAVAASPAVA